MRYVVAVLVLLLSACGAAPPAEVEVGAACPDFSLKSLDGEKFDNDSFAGKPFVLSFWATWCQPCFAEIPVLKELEANGEIQIVTIALDEKGESAVRPFVDNQGIDYLVLLGNETIFTRFNGFSIPYTLVLDAQHQIVNIYRGPVTEESMQSDLDNLAASGAS